MPATPQAVEQLARALDAVARVIRGIRPEQWSGPTPCTDWDVRDIVAHLVGMNLVFAAILDGQPPPTRGQDPLGDDPVDAYTRSASMVRSAFERPGVLERVYRGPLGEASGAERLQIRVYDLLAHGWDLAQATGQPPGMPEDLAEQALLFVQSHLPDPARAGRFWPVQAVPDDAPAITRLVAYLGRPVGAGPPR
jgi:uncharacterized protein (TIGR03086 family)